MASFCQQGLRRIEAPTCDISFIARALGFNHLGARTITGRIDGLIAQCSFPRPLPAPRNRRPGEVGRQFTPNVTPRSMWLRHAVLAWLDNYMPPEGAAHADEAAGDAAALDMDNAARRLRLVGGRGA